MLNSNALMDFKKDHPFLWSTSFILGSGLVILLGFLGTLAVLSFTRSPLGSGIQNILSWLLATNSVQAMWYVTRSAGFASYLLLWLSTALGLAIPTKLFDRLMPRAATFDFHQFISLLAIGFIFLHVGVLMVDRYLPYTLAQILVPFLSPYRPVWVGVGVFAFYLTLLVTVTFYLRSRIGMKTFKVIHYFSLVSYLGVVLHSFLSGTDSSLPAVQGMYLITFLVIAFLTAYWVIKGITQPKRKNVPAARQGQKVDQLQRDYH
jgi:sulfoxide reductase heme-binding subunit YedZ